jgi:hypothetical protein
MFSGAVSAVQVIGVTNTQAVLRISGAAAASCTVEVSEESDYTPLVHDVDGDLFGGANLCGRSTSTGQAGDWTVVIGKRTIETASDGKNYSRALQAATLHYYRVVNGSDTVTGTFTTRTLPLGITRTDGYIPDGTPGYEGEPAEITVDTTTRNWTWIDPHTGVQARLLQIPGDHTEQTFLSRATSLVSSTGWTDPANAVANTPATYATFDGASCAPTCGGIIVEESVGIGFSYQHTNGTDYYTFTVTGFGSSADAADRTLEVCLVPNVKVYFQANFPTAPSDYYTRGTVCDTHTGAVIVPLVLPQGSEDTVTVQSTFRVHDYTLHVHGFQETDQNGVAKPRFMARKANGTGTISIRNARYGWRGSNVANVGSAGEFKRCSSLMRTDKTYLCMTAKETGSLYSIHSETGEVRFLGVVKYIVGIGVQYCNLDHVPWSETDPNAWICQRTTGGTQPEYGLFTYTGDGQNKAQDYVLTVGVDFTVSWVVPDLRGKLLAFYAAHESEWHSMLGGAGNYNRFNVGPFTSCSIVNIQKVGAAEYYVGGCRSTDADTPSWQFVLNSSAVVIAMTPMYATAPSRWCTNHYQDIITQPVVSVFGQKAQYKTQLAAGINDTTDTITLTSSCSGDCDGFHTGDPVAYSNTMAAESLQPLRVGDWLALTGYPAGDMSDSVTEYVQILSRISNTQFTISRGQKGVAAKSHLTGAAAYPICHSRPGSTGTGWSMFYHKGDSGQWTWDFLVDPYGLTTDGSGVWIFKYYGHTSSEYNVFTNGNLMTITAPGTFVMPTNKLMNTTWYQWEPLGFGGVNGIGTGNTYQSHVSMQSIQAGGLLGASMWNAHPFIGGAFTSIQVDGNGNVICDINAAPVDVNPSTGCAVGRVPGYTNVYRYVHVTTPYTRSPKHFAQFGATGHRILTDVSGPASVLTDASKYKFCTAVVAGECVPGSSPGQVYAAFPDAIEKPFCNGGEGFGFKPDLCIGNVEWKSSGSSQMIYGINSKTGMYNIPGGYESIANGSGGIRLLARHALSGGYRRMPGFSSTKPLANGRYALADWAHVSEGTKIAVIKVPPVEVDSKDRSTWSAIDVQIGSVPAGADNAIVEFGYSENGGNCNTRNEPCVAHRSTINNANPYSYATTEAATIGSGVSCASGCTVVIPAFPGRVVYYQPVFRAGSTVISRGSMQVAVAP